MQIIVEDQELGNYSKVCLSPHSSVILRRRKLYKSVTSKSFDDWTTDDVEMENYSPSLTCEAKFRPFRKKELLDQFHRSLSNLHLARSHITVKLEIVQRLKLKENREHVQNFVTRTDVL